MTPSWIKILRPPGKLPVPMALNAGSPTLFHMILHNEREKVKQIFPELDASPGRHIGCRRRALLAGRGRTCKLICRIFSFPILFLKESASFFPADCLPAFPVLQSDQRKEFQPHLRKRPFSTASVDSTSHRGTETVLNPEAAGFESRQLRPLPQKGRYQP